MHVADVWRRLLRRRPARLRAVLIGCAAIVVLAVAGGAIGWSATSTTWTSRTAAVLVPPESGSTGENPLLRLDTDLVSLTPVLATAMDSPTARMALRRQDASAPFHVDTGAAPLIRFRVDSSSPAAARRTATALLSVARDQLDLLQSRADADGSQRATLLTVLSPTRPVRRGASRWTVAARVAAVIAALAVLSLALFAALRRRPTVTPVPRPSTRRLRRLDTGEKPTTPVVPRTR